MPVEFHDYSVQVKDEIENAAIKWLYEASDELTSQTARRTSQNFKEFRVKESWKRTVFEGSKEAKIGSNTEAAFWEEMGTGEHAIDRSKSRHGWWVFCEESSKHPSRQKVRTQEEAEETAAYLRSEGLTAHATNGTEPNRPLFKAFEATKAAIIRRAEEIFKGL